MGRGLVAGLGARFAFTDGHSGAVPGPAALDAANHVRAARYWSAAAARRARDPAARRLVLTVAAGSGGAAAGSLAGRPRPPAPLLPASALLIPLESPQQQQQQPSVRDESLAEQAQRRTKAFNEQLRAHPHDVSLWLRLVAFQDEALNAEGGAKMAAVLVDRKLVRAAVFLRLLGLA